MDPLLVAAYSSTASGRLSQDAQGRGGLLPPARRPPSSGAPSSAAPAVVVAAAVVVAGLIGQ